MNKIKVKVVEIPIDRFIVKIKGIEIGVSDMDDLEILIAKYGWDEKELIGKESDIPAPGKDGAK